MAHEFGRGPSPLGVKLGPAEVQSTLLWNRPTVINPAAIVHPRHW